MDGRSLAALIGAGNFGGTPLPLLSRRQREQLKRQDVGGAGEFRAPRPDITGARVLGPFARYVLSLPTSREERGKRNCSYLPHQGAKECERRR